MKVKMNQPWDLLVGCSWWEGVKVGAYHQEQTHRGQELVLQGRLDLEPTGGQDDSEGEPETTIRRQSSSTESVSDSHFPVSN